MSRRTRKTSASTFLAIATCIAACVAAASTAQAQSRTDVASTGRLRARRVLLVTGAALGATSLSAIAATMVTLVALSNDGGWQRYDAGVADGAQVCRDAQIDPSPEAVHVRSICSASQTAAEIGIIAAVVGVTAATLLVVGAFTRDDARTRDISRRVSFIPTMAPGYQGGVISIAF